MQRLAFILLSGISFDGTIGIGSLINGAVILMGFVASWYKMQARSDAFESQAKDTDANQKELSRQLQLLSLTIERLSTISEINEKRWEHKEK